MNLQITYDSYGSYLTIIDIDSATSELNRTGFIYQMGQQQKSANTVCLSLPLQTIHPKNYRIIYKDITLLWLGKIDLCISSGLFHQVIATVQLSNSKRYG